MSKQVEHSWRILKTYEATSQNARPKTGKHVDLVRVSHSTGYIKSGFQNTTVDPTRPTPQFRIAFLGSSNSDLFGFQFTSGDTVTVWATQTSHEHHSWKIMSYPITLRMYANVYWKDDWKATSSLLSLDSIGLIQFHNRLRPRVCWRFAPISKSFPLVCLEDSTNASISAAWKKTRAQQNHKELIRISNSASLGGVLNADSTRIIYVR